MKEEKHAPKEALDATAFAKLFFVWFHYASVTLPLRFLLILKGEDEGQPVAEGVTRHAAREDDLVQGIDRAALSLV